MVEDYQTWNPQHLTIVRQGAKAIREWLDKNPGARLELRRANLGRADLSGADLTRANLVQAHLVEANLANANLTGANLGDAVLGAANLTGANLSDADLTHANMTHALLVDANLTGANLGGADLTHANLAHARLVNANLIESDFTGADLGRADVTNAVFGLSGVSTDLTEAVGLGGVRHARPSFVSHDVLLRPTKRPWPISFLRGCGLTDAEIDFVQSFRATPIEFFSCFISYSTKDGAFAVKLHDALQSKGIRCWLDKHAVLPGDNIYAKVNEGIRHWDKVLLLCSEHSLTSWWVKDEIARGLEKERKLEKERGHEVLAIVPLDLDGYLFDDDRCTQENAPTLRKRHAAKFVGWDRDDKVFDAQLARVVKALRADELARTKPPPPKL